MEIITLTLDKNIPEVIHIGNKIKLFIKKDTTSDNRNRIRIGIEVPKEIKILRSELKRKLEIPN